MNERQVSQAQRQQAGQAQQNALAVRAQDALVEDVREGAKQALTTLNANQFAMAFVQENEKGEKTISPYIKKAGRSVILNQVAQKKGGIALMIPICVRSSQETKEDLLAILTALSDTMKSEFIKSRGGDFRCLSVPNGRSLYKFRILFKNGEKWEAEGVAWPGNTRMSSLHSRLDELAQTRAFMRCVGMGTGDGFMDPEDAAGGDGWLEATEAALIAEDEAIEHEASGVTEADPDGSGPFRSPDSGGTADPRRGQGGPERAQTCDSAQEGPATTDDDEPFPSGSTVSEQQAGGHSGQAGGESVPEVSVNDLMALARSKGVYLLKEAQDQFGADITKLSQLTDFQRTVLREELLDLPDKGATR